MACRLSSVTNRLSLVWFCLLIFWNALHSLLLLPANFSIYGGTQRSCRMCAAVRSLELPSGTSSPRWIFQSARKLRLETLESNCNRRESMRDM